MTSMPGESPRLKSLTGTPDGRSLAEPAVGAAAGGAPKVVARQGVPSACLPDPHPTGRARVIGWLHVVLPDTRNAPPQATSNCDCGRHVEATGRRNVAALVDAHIAHRNACPLHTAPEKRHAA